MGDIRNTQHDPQDYVSFVGCSVFDSSQRRKRWTKQQTGYHYQTGQGTDV
jgi:hypothetical protein